MSRGVVLALLFFASLPAYADDLSCETVATVHCAPVVPAPLPPQADDAEIPPRPTQPWAPVPEPDPCCTQQAPPTYAPDLAIQIPSGWHLARTHEGLMIERKKRTGVASVWAPGLTLWMLSYLGGTIGGVSSGRAWTAAPFLGTFIASGVDLSDGKVGPGVGWAIGGILQVSGFVMFLVGNSLGEKIERMPIAIGPYYSSEGGGLSVAGRF